MTKRLFTYREGRDTLKVNKERREAMAQSIRSRLDGNLPQFLEDVRKFGLWPAMEQWELEKSYLAVRKIVLEETGDENFGLHPATGSYANQGIRGFLREFVVAFADYTIKADRKNRELEQALEMYKANGKSVEREFVAEMTDVLEFCRQY